MSITIHMVGISHVSALGAHVGGSKLKRHKSVVHRILHTLSPCLWVEVLGYPELKRHKAVVHRI